MNSSTEVARPIRKFVFETVFDDSGAIVRDGNGFRSQYNAEEVAEIRAAAFEEGRQASEREIAAALAALSQTMGGLVAQLDRESATLRQEAVDFALAAARAAAGIALEAHGEARVISALTHALEVLRVGPRLVVRLSPDLVAGLKSRLEDAARAQGFEGALIVRGDGAIAAGDVALEWAEGAIIHDRAEAFARIEEMIRNTLDNADLELIDE
jgi:flagellar assembly protein FliH